MFYDMIKIVKLDEISLYSSLELIQNYISLDKKIKDLVLRLDDLSPLKLFFMKSFYEKQIENLTILKNAIKHECLKRSRKDNSLDMLYSKYIK